MSRGEKWLAGRFLYSCLVKFTVWAALRGLLLKAAELLFAAKELLEGLAWNTHPGSDSDGRDGAITNCPIAK